MQTQTNIKPSDIAHLLPRRGYGGRKYDFGGMLNNPETVYSFEYAFVGGKRPRQCLYSSIHTAINREGLGGTLVPKIVDDGRRLLAWVQGK